MDVLGSPSLIDPMIGRKTTLEREREREREITHVHLDVQDVHLDFHTAPELLVPNRPYGVCGCKATLPRSCVWKSRWTPELPSPSLIVPTVAVDVKQH